MPVPPWLAPHFATAGGRLRFDRFMQLALHDPRHGYYASRISAVGGPRADFTTAPMLTPALARAIAARLLDHHRRSGLRDAIELGPGEGTLTRDVRAALPWPVRRRLRFHLVESSPTLAARQQQLLGTRPRWHSHPAHALAATHGHAFLFANELIDSFPARRFHLADGRWHESFITINPAGALAETFQPAPDLPDSTFFAATAGLPAAATVEVHAAFRDWLADWTGAWTAGELLLVDYGGRLAHFRRNGPAGTLRGYLHHQLLTGSALLAHPGRHDLTADVNFDDLVHWGARLGLRTVSLAPLARLLALDPLHASPTERQLLAAGGAGEAFQVLILSPAAVRQPGDFD